MGGAVAGAAGTVFCLGLSILVAVILVNQKIAHANQKDTTANPADGPVPTQVSKKPTHVIPVEPQKPTHVIPADPLALAQVTGADFQSLCDAIREDNVRGPTGFCALVSRCMLACVCTLTRAQPHPRPGTPV